MIGYNYLPKFQGVFKIVASITFPLRSMFNSITNVEQSPEKIGINCRPCRRT